MTIGPLTGATSELGDLLDSDHAELPGRLIAWRDAAVAAERERWVPCVPALEEAAWEAEEEAGYVAGEHMERAHVYRELAEKLRRPVTGQSAPKGEGQ